MLHFTTLQHNHHLPSHTLTLLQLNLSNIIGTRENIFIKNIASSGET